MRIEATYNSILKIGAPIMLFNFVQNIIGFTDTVFLGRVGILEFSACGLMSIFYMVLVMIGFGLSRGAQILIARRAGEEKYNELGRIFDHLLVVELLLAIGLFGFVHFFAMDVLGLFVQSEELLDQGWKYLNYRSYGLFFGGFAFSVLALYTGIGKTRIIIYITLILAVINVGLNYSLIFGKFGLPEMKIAGAGLASSIAEVIAGAVGLIYVLIDKSLKRLNLFSHFRLDWRILKRLMQLSTPLILQFLAGLGGWFIFFTFIENMGEQALAVSVILRWIYTFYSIPAWGFASAVNTVVSNVIGQRKFQQALLTMRRANIISFISTTIIALTLLIFPDLIVSIFTDKAHLIDATKPLLIILIFILLMASVATTTFNTIMGTGATQMSLLIEVSGVVVYLIYGYMIVNVFQLSLGWVWMAEFIYWTFLFIFSLLFIYSDRWKRYNF